MYQFPFKLSPIHYLLFCTASLVPQAYAVFPWIIIETFNCSFHLQPFLLPQQIWSNITCDQISSIPSSKTFQGLLPTNWMKLKLFNMGLRFLPYLSATYFASLVFLPPPFPHTTYFSYIRSLTVPWIFQTQGVKVRPFTWSPLLQALLTNSSPSDLLSASIPLMGTWLIQSVRACLPLHHHN